MTDVESKLKSILGEDFFNEIAAKGATNDGKQSPTEFHNCKKIICECNTLVLRPGHARLILPSDSMKEAEKHLKFLQSSDKCFKNLTRGCYWLVDDMYKFEQIGYSKEINLNQQQPSCEKGAAAEQNASIPSESFQKSDDQQSSSPTLKGLKYLFCAECDLCPLGWFDEKTKESYLYVW